MPESRSANEYQVGGSHYKSEDLQHWDVVARTGNNYFVGQVTKYLSRWRAKNGVEDLLKARHYAEKMGELTDKLAPLGDALTDYEEGFVLRFCCDGNFDRDERRLLRAAFAMRTGEAIQKFISSLDEFINSLPRGRVL